MTTIIDNNDKDNIIGVQINPKNYYNNRRIINTTLKKEDFNVLIKNYNLLCQEILVKHFYCDIYFNSNENETTIKSIYKDYYDGHPFTHVIDKNPDLKMVTNTNKALINVSKIEDQVLVITVIDNLLKGASGQAIQNMNLIFDLDEAAGLALKSNVY